MRQRFRIALLMHSTRSDNLGVGALTVSQVELLRGIGAEMGLDLTIRVIDFKGDRAPYVFGDDIEIIDMNTKFLLSPRGLYAALRGSDLVIDIGAGDSFADIYGRKRLLRLFAAQAVAWLARCKIVVAPQTIGPFTKPLSRALARLSLGRAALVATRDPASTAAAKALGVAEVIEASDLALALPFAPALLPKSKPKVGLNVSGLLMMGGYSGRNDYGITLDYPALMRYLVAGFEARGAEVHLIAHVVSDAPERRTAEDDYPACVALHRAFPQTVLAPIFPDPVAAKSYIAAMDFVAGARMHACIAAFSAGVAVVPMAYSRKFAGLFGALGYGETVECTSEQSTDIAAKIFAAYEAREDVAALARRSAEVGRARVGAYRSALMRVIAQVLEAR